MLKLICIVAIFTLALLNTTSAIVNSEQTVAFCKTCAHNDMDCALAESKSAGAGSYIGYCDPEVTSYTKPSSSTYGGGLFGAGSALAANRTGQYSCYVSKNFRFNKKNYN
jgi:hypothetical protein